MSTIPNSNIRRLDLGALRALQRLLADPNLSRVGREVGLSQPAMSHLLTRLRDACGDPLLIRDGKSLVLTQYAEELRPKLEALIPQLGALFDREQFEPSRATTLFKIAITDHAGQVLLARLLRDLSEAAPLARTSIAMIPNRQTDLAALDEQKFDLRIGWLRSLPPHWHQRKLLDDEIVLIAANDHPLAAGPMTLEQFSQLNHIGLESEKPIYPNLVDRRLAEAGLKRNVLVRVSHFSIVPSIVAETRLVAMFPRRLAQTSVDQGLVTILPCPIAFEPNNLSMAWHPRTNAAPDQRWLRRLVVEVSEELCGHG